MQIGRAVVVAVLRALLMMITWAMLGVEHVPLLMAIWAAIALR